MSFLVGLGVGVIYGLLRVKSPAPPIIALIGRFGIVLGEQIGVWARETKINVARAASVCLVGESWGHKHPSDANERLAIGLNRNRIMRRG